MKKFRCTVTRTDEYEIELDENVMNEEWMKEFREVYYDFHYLEEHAEHIAQHRARFGMRYFSDYGDPLVDGMRHWSTKEGEEAKHINIKVLSEDEECVVEVEEID
ncbi:hypothetical protein [Shouchella clausii]|uniref:hypothetical protein n=1 Tax=Shouchella clausii TaxID=79880 RepID=UPI001C736DE9|nr:hypothetical protein [Shouchella clausii]MBX0320277.1 hypothetical protein [Shouchella clausii]MEB5480958.1 hypothetical protein [Shouchella clausii]